MEPTSFWGRDGNRLAADVAGPVDARPVLFFHGGGQTRHSWGSAVATIGSKGWRAYTIDMRGHGESEWAADGDYTIDAFAGDVIAVARAVTVSSGQRPALVGASLGGLASLAALGLEPAAGVADALVLVDVAPRTEEKGRERIGDFMRERAETGFESLEEVAEAVSRYNPHRPPPKDLSGLRKNLRQRDGRWYWHWDPAFLLGIKGSEDETRSSVADVGRLEDAARSLQIPLLVVRGLVSDLLSEQGAQELLDLVPGSELVTVSGAGHMVAGDRNDLFSDAVINFLQRLDRS